jgi:membrane-bound inhibitor of C-type lysozyme
MITKRVLAAFAVFAGTAVPAMAAQTSVSITLGNEGGDLERRVIVYDCEVGDPISVQYINAAPNFLAILPVPDQTEPLVFAAVLSASGVRYAAGQFIWSTKGVDATLTDITEGEDADPINTCSEVNNTP